MPRRTKSDDLDHHILKLLCADGRMQIIDLAARIGLSQSATAKRLGRLENEGIILGFTAILGGRDFVWGDQVARVMISAERPSLRLCFEDEVRACDAILSAKRMMGAGEYVLRGSGRGFALEVQTIAARSGVQIKNFSSSAIDLEIKPLRGAPLLLGD